LVARPVSKGQRAVIGGTAALLISLLLWFMIAKALLRGLAIEA
jgi:hypothetical protein